MTRLEDVERIRIRMDERKKGRKEGRKEAVVRPVLYMHVGGTGYSRDAIMWLTRVSATRPGGVDFSRPGAEVGEF